MKIGERELAQAWPTGPPAEGLTRHRRWAAAGGGCSAGVQLKDLAGFFSARGIQVGLVRADDDLIATLTTYEVLGGDSQVSTYATMDAGLAAFQADQGASR
jgi:hypothetical protein